MRLELAVVARSCPSDKARPTRCGAHHHVGMALIVGTTAASRRVAPDEFARWSSTRTLFLSIEMRELAGLRETVANALRQAGFSVVMFENLGGRDENAERAYLDDVAPLGHLRRRARRPLRDDAVKRPLAHASRSTRRREVAASASRLAAGRRIQPARARGRLREIETFHAPRPVQRRGGPRAPAT